MATTGKGRRPYGSGSIVERTRRGKIYYIAMVSAGSDLFGKRDRRERWCTSKAAARIALRELAEEAKKVRAAPRSRIRLADYLDDWLKDLELSNRVKPSTLRLYKFVAKQIKDIGGDADLRRFSGQHALALYRRLEQNGKTQSARKKVHTVLSAALSDAVPRYLERNPLETLPRRLRPKYRAEKRAPYSLEEVQKFLEAADGDPLEALYVLALFSQAREGELLALKRKNVDVHAGAIYVEETGAKDSPKTKAGRRRIDLPAIATETLRHHLGKRSLLRRGASANELVFPGPRGAQILPRNLLRRSLYPLMERAKLRRITFHDLRHTGSTLIAPKVPLVVLRERMGHRSDSTTLLYAGHRTPGLGKIAVAAFDELFPVERPLGGETLAANGGTTAGRPLGHPARQRPVRGRKR